MERPVLLGVGGHAVSVLEETGGGLVFPPEDAEALVAAACELAAMPERGRELGRRGRVGALAGYDLDALARRYVDLLERLAPAGKGVPTTDGPPQASPSSASRPR
jgi:colanic acid biosynthesis glycosyl transferase WcaI